MKSRKNGHESESGFRGIAKMAAKNQRSNKNTDINILLLKKEIITVPQWRCASRCPEISFWWMAMYRTHQNGRFPKFGRKIHFPFIFLSAEAWSRNNGSTTNLISVTFQGCISLPLLKRDNQGSIWPLKKKCWQQIKWKKLKELKPRSVCWWSRIEKYNAVGLKLKTLTCSLGCGKREERAREEWP